MSQSPTKMEFIDPQLLAESGLTVSQAASPPVTTDTVAADVVTTDAVTTDTITTDTVPIDTVPVNTVPVDTIPVNIIPFNTIPIDGIPVDNEIQAKLAQYYPVHNHPQYGYPGYGYPEYSYPKYGYPAYPYQECVYPAYQQVPAGYHLQPSYAPDPYGSAYPDTTYAYPEEPLLAANNQAYDVANHAPAIDWAATSAFPDVDFCPGVQPVTTPDGSEQRRTSLSSLVPSSLVSSPLSSSSSPPPPPPPPPLPPLSLPLSPPSSPSVSAHSDGCITVKTDEARPRPKPRPKRRAPKARRRGPKELLPEETLGEPLSKLAARVREVAAVDMDTFVRRGADERGVYGRAFRPLNAFLLYRKAYGDYAKHLKNITRNDTVSKIIGASWRQEEPAVKDRFLELARVERDEHARHFPDYKYAPAQRDSAKRSGARKKRKADKD